MSKSRLFNRYREEIVPSLMEKFEYKSIMQVPRLEKICLNQGVNGAVQDKKLVDVAVTEMTDIAGQKAVPGHSRPNSRIPAPIPTASAKRLYICDGFVDYPKAKQCVCPRAGVRACRR